MDIKGLIEGIIYDLANNIPLSSVVSKIQVVSKLIKNDTFKSWIENEFIYGYSSNLQLPDYRQIWATNVKASFLHHQGFGRILQYSHFDVPIANLGTDSYQKTMSISFKETVSALEQILIENKKNLTISLTAYEKLLVQKNILIDCEISTIYKEISRYDLQNIINTAKAKLLDIFIELNETVFDNELNFNKMERKDKISQIVNQTINTGVYIGENSKAHIQDSTVVGGTENNVKFSNDFQKDIMDLVNKIEEISKDIEIDREDIAFEISKIKLALDKGESTKLIKSAFNAIKGVASNVAANGITDLLNNTLPNIKF